MRRTFPAALCVALVAVLALANGAAAHAPELARYPYLTDVVGSNATVNWATDRTRTSGRVRYGRADVESCTAHTATATRSSITVNGVGRYAWRAGLTDLAPGVRYCYRVEFGSAAPVIDLLGAEPSPEFLAQLPAGSSEPFSFAVLGDWGAAGETHAGLDNRQADVMAQISASGVRFAVGTGDTAYPSGTQTNYGDLVQTGPNVSGVFGPNGWSKVGASTPFFNPVGNHGFNATHLSVWPQGAAVSGSGGRYLMEDYCCANGTQAASYPSAWYAFDAGDARFYVLEAAWSSANVGTADAYKNDYDAHWTPASAEYQWLEEDLRTHPRQLKFAFFHYPLYSSNVDEASDTYLQGEGSLEGLLARNGVDLGFSGHSHNYTRNARPGPGSLVTYVTGGGGARLEPATRCGAPVAYAVGWSYSSGGSNCGAAPRPTSTAEVFHFLKVSVDGTRVTVTPIDSQGRAFDVQTYDFPDGGTPALVRQGTGATPALAPASSFSVPVSSAGGDALVASIAVQAGSTTTVSTVTDSAGNSWTRGPVGFLAGSNTRTELWYSTGASPVTSVTVGLSAADLAAANVSVWSGVAAAGALDGAAGQGNSSSTGASTPAIQTAGAPDVLVGAINYPRSATSTLASPGFDALTDFSVSTVRGRAAYRIASAAGNYSAAWTLSAASPSGGAIVALKGAP